MYSIFLVNYYNFTVRIFIMEIRSLCKIFAFLVVKNCTCNNYLQTWLFGIINPTFWRTLHPFSAFHLWWVHRTPQNLSKCWQMLHSQVCGTWTSCISSQTRDCHWPAAAEASPQQTRHSFQSCPPNSSSQSQMHVCEVEAGNHRNFVIKYHFETTKSAPHNFLSGFGKRPIASLLALVFYGQLEEPMYGHSANVESCQPSGCSNRTHQIISFP